MNEITFPLKPGMRGRKVTDLHDALLLLIEKVPGVFQPPQPPTHITTVDWGGVVERLGKEREKRYYGKVTRALVSAFQKYAGIQTSGAVDEKTAAAINDFLGKLGLSDGGCDEPQEEPGKAIADNLTIKGTVVSRYNGKGVEGLTVEAHDQTGRIKEPLGSAGTDEKGFFEIQLNRRFQKDLLKRRPDIFFRLFAGREQVISTKNSVTWNPRNPDLQVTISIDRLSGKESMRFLPKRFAVKGRVTRPDGTAISGLRVQAFERVGSRERTLGTAVTDQGGYYAIFYTLEEISNPARGAVDLVVRVHDGQTQETLATSPLILNALEEEEINFSVGEEIYRGRSEYEVVDERLRPLLAGVELSDVAEGDLAVMANQAGLDVEQAQLFVEAQKHSIRSKIAPEELYGLYRTGMPYSLLALTIQSEESLRKSLEKARSLNLIPPQDPQHVDKTVAMLRSLGVREMLSKGSPSRVRAAGLMDAAGLSSREKAEVLRLFSELGDRPEEFWSRMNESSGVGKKKVERLHLLFQFDALSLGHGPLAERLAVREDIKSLKDLASMDREDWKSFLEREDISPPDHVPGKGEAEKRENYALILSRIVEASYPTAYFSAGWYRDEALDRDIAAFFSGNPGFAFEEQGINTYLKEHPEVIDGFEDKSSVTSKLREVQNLFRISPRFDRLNVVKSLWADGMRSSHKIKRMGKEKFIARYGQAIGREQAQVVYANAEKVASFSLITLAKYVWDTNGITPYVIPTTDLSVSEDGDGRATLENLFGNLDFCDCKHCRSVLGPAAYLVDLLVFLNNATAADGSTGLDKLFSRRPDIGELELSCENTNTIVPYIDLVNEVLEDQIAPLPVYTLPVSLESQLEAGRIKSAVRDALHGRGLTLSEEAELEVVEKGGIWAIRDVFGYYKIHKDGAQLTVKLSRQTLGTADELRAHPGYINPAAYDELKEAKYPWSLPFDLWVEEARAYLGQLGVKRHELMEVFSGSGADSPSEREVLGEALGLTPAERSLVTVSVTDETELKPLWGVNSGSLAGAVEKADDFLARAGIDYGQLESLLQCRFINPDLGATDATRISFDEDNPCSLGHAKLTNLDANRLDRIHRFMRLAKKLGWSFFDLDRALFAFGKTDIDEDFLEKLSLAIQIKDRLGVDLLTVFSWWPERLDTARYKDVPSQYDELFRNRALGELEEEVRNTLSLNESGAELSATDKKMTDPDYEPVILGAARITKDDLTLIIAEDLGGSDELNLANLSHVVRVASFCRAVGTSVQEFYVLRKLAGIHPLTVPGGAGAGGASPARKALPRDTKEFLDAWKTVKDSGVSLAKLAYLFTHDTQLPNSGVLLPEVAADRLSEIRADLKVIHAACQVPEEDLEAALTEKLGGIVEDGEILNALIQVILGRSSLSEEKQGDLISDNLGEFLDAEDARAKLVTGGGSLGDNVDRMEYVLEPLLDYLYPLQAERYLNQKMAENLSLGTDAVSALLEVVKHPDDGTRSARDLFIDKTFVTSTDAIDSSTYPVQFGVYERIYKFSSLISGLKIGTDDQEFAVSNGKAVGWVDVNALPLEPKSDDSEAAALFKCFTSMVKAFQVWPRIRTSGAALSEFMREVLNTGDVGGIRQLLVDHTAWSSADIETLTGNYGYDVTDLQKTDWLVALHRAFSILGRLGVGAEQAWSWNRAETGSDEAVRIKLAVKSKYDNDEWLSIAPAIRDGLRGKQRDALLAYVIQDNKGFKDADDVYAHLLIDPEMNACRDTSRIVQAISSVQLFVQRILMNLEAEEIEFTYADAKQWKWRKNYRLWEANRKVFLWPENWIYPDLRSDKSPFFKELEDELAQSDIDNDSAERALMSYLKKLDEVAHLEVCGMYEEVDDEADQYILHVVARTQGTPHKYFYRRWMNRQYWTPWERVEADIEGDHLIPVVHNRRLFLFWPKFIEKAEEVKGSEMSDVRDDDKKPDDPRKYYEIRIAWTQYRDGKWREVQVSTDFFETEHSTELRPKGEYYFYTESTSDGDLLIRCRIIPPEKVGSGKILRYLWELYTVLGYNDITDTVEKRSGYSSYRNIYLNKLPDGDNRFMFIEKTKAEGELSVYTRLSVGSKGIVVDPSETTIVPLLESAQGGFRVMLPHQYPTYTSQSPFFYLDGKRVFFVEPKDHIIKAPKWVAKKSFGISKEEFFTGAKASVTGSWLGLAEDAVVLERGKKETPFYDGAKGVYVSTVFDGMVIDRSGGTASLYRAGDDRYVGVALSADSPSFSAMAVTGGALSTAAGISGEFSSLSVIDEIRNSITESHLFDRLKDYGWVDVTYKKFHFQAFYHPYVPLMIQQVNRYGVEGLFAPTEDHLGNWKGMPTWKQLKRQQGDTGFDFSEYGPTHHISSGDYPEEDFDFSFGGAYSQYNWELFFHVPLLIAERLMQNQKFEEAQKWFHYIFDPTETEGAAPKRFWQIKPFFEYDGEASIEKLMELLNDGDEEMEAQVEAWENDPFNPHLIARMRTVAYMRTVVMKYIDNLIAWGDSLFRRFSTESLNEATQIYVLAAQILGRKPERIEKTDATVRTFNELLPKLDEFSNALVTVESSLPWMTSHGSGSSTGESSILDTLYFCIPQNEKLLGYWKTVADRLFKLRNCMDIEGVRRQPALFEPPIDPGLLVKARAMGLELSSILSDLSAPLPYYRFRVILQRANEFCADVRALGSALLQALEKRDAEELSLLRASNQIDLLKSLREVKEKAIEEAKHNKEALEERKRSAEIRFDHYDSLEFMNPWEIAGVSLNGLSLAAHGVAITADVLAGVMFLIPNFQVGASGFGGTPHFTAKTGGDNMGKSVERGANGLYQIATLLDKSASLSYTMASYFRRQEEWDLQRDLAEQEKKDLEKQILAAKLRIEMAEKDLASQELQIEQAEAEAQFLESKFTNRELYNWMVTQISTLYFQAYQLAYDLARKAEQCFRFELGVRNSNYIQFGYWDSLKKGLLAGERLQKDLRRLEAAYLELNRREFELTKHVSLAQLNPVALLQLKEAGTCEFTVPEVLFDLDHPGHYMRRIKTVRITIPCVVGPYTTVGAKLTMLENRVRTSTDTSGGYAYKGLEDSRFVHDLVGVQSIATSSAKQDAGLFELSFGDERYLPFEGAGAVSRWRLELPEEYRHFDYDTISDVILHLQYTARDGGEPLKTSVQDELKASLNKIADILAGEETGLTRIVSAKHEFGTEWHRFMNPAADETSQVLDLKITKSHFPFMFKERSLKVREVGLVLFLENVDDYAGGGQLAVTVKMPDGTEVSDNLTGNPQLGGQPTVSNETDFTFADGEMEIGLRINESAIGSISDALVEERGGKKRLKIDSVVDLIVIFKYTVER